MPFFRTSNPDLRAVIHEYNEQNLPPIISDIPTATGEVLGHDANLSLLIREMAPVQLKSIRVEREKLTKRLADLDEKERMLNELLHVVTSN